MFLLLCALLFAAPKGPSWGPTAEQIDLYNTAVGHFNTGDLAEAQTAIELVLKAQPDCGAARAIRGLEQQRPGRIDAPGVPLARRPGAIGRRVARAHRRDAHRAPEQRIRRAPLIAERRKSPLGEDREP